MTHTSDAQGMSLAPGVVETIISIATSSVDGVASVGSRTAKGIRSLFGNKQYSSGIEAQVEDGKVVCSVHVEVYFGYVLPELAKDIRHAIANALLTQVGLECEQVDVYVDGLRFSSK